MLTRNALGYTSRGFVNYNLGQVRFLQGCQLCVRQLHLWEVRVCNQEGAVHSGVLCDMF